MLRMIASRGPAQRELARWACGVCGARYDSQAGTESCGGVDAAGAMPALRNGLLVVALLIFAALLLSVVGR